MSTAVPYQLQYTNQLQFNLGVPPTTHNLAAQFKRPSPIFVERIGGQHGIPTSFVGKQVSGAKMAPRSSVCNYSALSEDKMEMMSVLAKRDLRNRKLQLQMRKSPSSESLSPTCSPSRSSLRQKSSCERFAREETVKSRKPLTAKQGDKNRRLGAVQTPPPQRPTTHFKSDNSMAYSRNTSMNVSRDSDLHFPAKPILPEGGSQPKDEIEKLQQEVEAYLLLVEHIGERSSSEPGVKFLEPHGKGKQKDEFLLEEENSDRVRMRVEEQNTRLTRNLYNLKLKVKQVQRDTAHADISKPAKRSQILSQLGMVLRGALKALQTLVNQLHHQDLSRGLPPHYHELALLLRQLTALSALVKQGNRSEGDSRLLAVLDRVNNLNAKWCLDQHKTGSVPDKIDKKSVITKDWISDTKVDKNIFVMKNQPEVRFTSDTSKVVIQPPWQQRRQQTQRGRPKKRAPGKENRGKDRLELRSAITTLLQPKARAGIKEHKASSGVAWDVGMDRQALSQDPRKGYLLPYDLIAKRQKAQRAVILSNQEKRYADPTYVTSLKRSPVRPSSAPANVRHKEVNFDLDLLSPTPWIPPGRYSRSRSLSSEPKPQSRSPFYLRDMSSEDVRYMFPDKQSLRSQTKKADGSVPRYGFHSLPSEKKLRSAAVSSSFIDEVEHRLMRRMAGRAAGKIERSSRSDSVPDLSPRKEGLSADTTEVYSDLDEPLDTTDLVEEARKEAVSAMDAPTIENMKHRLSEMQREQTEIRQRWSTLKFTNTQPRSRIPALSHIQSDRYRDPPATTVTKMYKTERPKTSGTPISNEWTTEPMIFTKPSQSSRGSFHRSVEPTKQISQPSSVQGKPPKKLVTLKQTLVEKISADRDRFQSYLRKRSHHPSGKFDPWKLMEEISDEILSDCLTDVANEVESISEEIANHMYKSEFVVDKSLSEAAQSDAALHRKHSESQLDQPLVDAVQYQPINEGAAYSYGRVEPIGIRRAPSKLDSLAMGEMFLGVASGDQLKVRVDRTVPVRILSPPRTHVPVKILSPPRTHVPVRILSPPRTHVPVRILSPPRTHVPVKILSPPRSHLLLSPDRLSPIISAAEPQLDDISHLLHREDRSLEREERGGGDVESETVGKKEDENEDDEYEDDYEESSNEENSKDESFENGNDDDSNGYEQDEFEDVTDSELKKL